MAGRIRSIKPELLEDEKACALSDSVWRLFVSSWLMADDYGNLRAHPAFLRSSAFCGRDISTEDMEAMIDDLTEAGFWLRYEANGESYAHITGWSKHQRVDKPGKPRIPGPNSPDVWVQEIKWTYFMQRESGGPIKIGKSNYPERRAVELSKQQPEKLVVLAKVKGNIERELHRRFVECRITGEWFEESPELLGVVSEAKDTGAIRSVPTAPRSVSAAPRKSQEIPANVKLPEPNARPARERLFTPESSTRKQAEASFPGNPRKSQETSAPDLRPTTTEQDHRTGKGSGEFSCLPLREEPQQLELYQVPSATIAVEADDPKPSSRNSDANGSIVPIRNIAWGIWRKSYKLIYRREYIDSGACQRSMASLAVTARRHVKDRTDIGEHEDAYKRLFTHWFRSFLMDKGRNGFLKESGHLLQYLDRSIPTYGVPWDPAAKMPPWPQTTEPSEPSVVVPVSEKPEVIPEVPDIDVTETESWKADPIPRDLVLEALGPNVPEMTLGPSNPDDPDEPPTPELLFEVAYSFEVMRRNMDSSYEHHGKPPPRRQEFAKSGLVPERLNQWRA